MKNLSAVVLFLFINVNFLSAQIDTKDLYGDWIKCKIEMKDGSRLYDRYFNDSTFIMFSFRNNNIMMISNDPCVVNGSSLNFSIDKNVIKINNDLYNTPHLKIVDNSYIIEKLTNDTLIIVENFSLPDDKLKRYYCVNHFKCIRNMQDNDDKNNFVANRYSKPTMKKGGIDFDPPKVDFNLYGDFIFDIENKKLNIAVKSGNLEGKALKKFVESLEKTYDRWDLRYFEKFKTVTLPFYFRNLYKSDVGSTRLTGFNYAFVINSLPGNNVHNLADSKASSNYYKQGLIAFKDNNNEKAIECFTNSFRFDKYNIEAIYSRAAIYYHTGKKIEACADWKLLESLGQMRAKNELIKYCK
jgi:hypothetical protein